jgi:hypothetical protein
VGRCYDLPDTPPYGPWIALFDPLHRCDPTASPRVFAERGDVGTGASLADIVDQTRHSLATRGSPHSWYVTPFTITADVGETPAARGLVRQEQANMAIALAALPETASEPADCTIEEVYGAERFDEWGRTYVTRYRMPPAMAARALATLRRRRHRERFPG